MRRRIFALLALVLLTGGSAARGQEPAVAGVAGVLVEKAARRLTLLDARGDAVRVYAGIQLGFAPVGPKRFEGDGRTPEGRYTIDYGNPQSAYHLSLHISYPDSDDVAFARAQGRSAGGQIFLHGQPDGRDLGPAPGDWTDGCIALADRDIEELWTLVGDGTPIEIRP